MEPTATKLWNRDFSLLVIGQVISIFGNMILSWALPFYVLDITGSAAMFGLVLAVPNVSLLIMSPIGGILADRFRKQRIMFWLDLSATIIVVLYMATSGFFVEIVPVIMVKLLALNAIQGMYMPAVQSAVPVLVPQDKLVSANASVGIVNALSNTAAPAAAGVLYGNFGLFPILVITAVCLAITAVMDLLIRVPFKKQPAVGSVAQIIKSDMSLAGKFVVKDKPILAKCAVIMFIFSVTIAATLLVGLPVLITQHLGMEMNMVGVNQSFMMAGGIIGGIATGALGERMTIQRAWFPLLLCSLAIAPIGAVFLFNVPVFAAFVIMTAASTLTLAFIQLCNIQLMSFIQRETPTELIGKVMSILLILPFVANALGQVLIGVLFEQLSALPWIIVFVASAISVAVTLYSRKHFSNIKSAIEIKP